MSYRDELIRCAACGSQFVYTVKEQRRRVAQGLPAGAPAFCAECRGADVRLAAPEAAGDSEADDTNGSPERGAGTTPSDRSSGSSQGRPRRGGERRPRRDGDSGARKGRGAQKGRARRPAPPLQTEIRVRHLGTVKWFDDDRGFGFIAQDDGEELFVHMTSVLVPADPPLEPGQQVEYEIVRTDKGPQAVDVVPIG